MPAPQGVPSDPFWPRLWDGFLSAIDYGDLVELAVEVIAALL